MTSESDAPAAATASRGASGAPVPVAPGGSRVLSRDAGTFENLRGASPGRRGRRRSARSGVWYPAISAAIGALLWLAAWFIARTYGGDRGTGAVLLAVDLVVGLAAVALVRWRHARPRLVTGVLGLAMAVSSFSNGPWMLAGVSLATRRRWSDLVVVEVTTLVGSLAYDRVHPESSPDSFWPTALSTTILVGAVTAFGWYVGARRDLVESLHQRAETAEREKLAFLETARANERAAIAREMHDVLAHRISLVAMHAGALAFRPDLDAEARDRIVRTIEANAQLALTDLRDVLGVLRDPSSTFADRPAPPQPVLDDLGRLVAETVEAGTPVEYVANVAGAPPTTLGRHAYRIAQEALTNARKHAPGLAVALTVRGGAGDGLVVEATNPVPLHPFRRFTGAGAGLTGMAERAELAGGTLTHGRTPDGRYRVLASLPWPANSSAVSAPPSLDTPSPEATHEESP